MVCNCFDNIKCMMIEKMFMIDIRDQRLHEVKLNCLFYIY